MIVPRFQLLPAGAGEAEAALVAAAEVAESLVERKTTQDNRERVQIIASRLWNLT